jgi:hypothetical protein
MMNQTNPFTSRRRRSVGVFPQRRDAEHALHELRDSGFPMDLVSVIARDADQRDSIAGKTVGDQPGNKADDGAKVGAISGGALGGLTGLLVGLGTLAIPGVGPILLAGAGATVLATALAGGAIGAVAGGLVGALIGIGIPEERARVYHDRVARGDYLVMVAGTDEEIARAEAILHHRGIEEYGVYDAPDIATTPVVAAPVATAPISTTSTVHDPGRDVSRSRQAIGFFTNPQDAEHAIHSLRMAGFPLSQVSLIARNLQRREQFAGVDLRDRFDAMRWEIPAERTQFYNDRLQRGDYIVVINGREDEVRRAESILTQHRSQGWEVYDPMPGNTSNRVEAAPLTGGATNRSGIRKRAIGFFSHRRDAEAAIQDLKLAGFPLNQISLVAQQVDRQGAFADLDTRDRLDNRQFGLPEDRFRFLHNRVARGDYLLAVTGTDTEIRQATHILNRRSIQEFSIYNAPDSGQTQIDHDRGFAPTPTETTYASPAPTSTTRLSQRKRAIGAFEHRQDAEAALTELRNSGFDMNHVSLIARDADRSHPIAGINETSHHNKADEGAKAGAATGGVLGGLGGLLVGLGALAIPGVGPIVLGGAAATALVTALSGGAIGAAAGGLAGGLVGLGIPEDRARLYNERFNRGDYLVMVDGTEEELHHAQAVLNRYSIRDWGVFDASDVNTSRTQTSNVGTNTNNTNYKVSSYPDVTVIDRRNEPR